MKNKKKLGDEKNDKKEKVRNDSSDNESGKDKKLAGKKKLLAITAIVIVAVLVIAVTISKKNDDSGDAQSNGGAKEKAGMDIATTADQPDNDPDIIGIVQSMKGNKATILLLEASALDGIDLGSASTVPVEGGAAGGPMGGDGEITMPENMGDFENMRQSGEMPADMPDRGEMPSGEMPSGGRSGGQGGNAASSNIDSETLSELKAKSTGEVTITIPVGIQMIMTSNDSTSGPLVQFTGVSANSVVKIWLNSEVDGSVAEFVSILG